MAGPVRQQAESFEVGVAELKPRYPALGALCDALVGEIHRHGVAEWVPNEVVIQRYHPGSLGTMPHRDHRRFAQLVAVVTVAGSASSTR